MDDTEAPKFMVLNVERATDFTGGVQTLVRFNVGNLYGNIATPLFETFAETEAWAFAELHRISSQIAATAAPAGRASSGPKPEAQPDRSPGDERNRKWDENQRRGTPWVP